MNLCTRAHIIDLLHAGYVAACEEQNPGIVERTIAAVISAYRTVEAITTLVDTEGNTANEWIPLQKQWKYCTALLEDIASGKLKLPLEESNPDREEPSFAVISRHPFFDLRGL